MKLDLEGLGPDETRLLELLHDRLKAGRSSYGEWVIGPDRRNYRKEALEECLDGLHYVAAELLRFVQPTKKVVYLAGPLTTGNQFVNVYLAVQSARRLKAAGLVPVVPHLMALWEMISPGLTYEDWMEMDLAIIERCDALLRLPGDSPGADREVEHAKAKGIPTFADEMKLLEWAGCVAS